MHIQLNSNTGMSKVIPFLGVQLSKALFLISLAVFSSFSFLWIEGIFMYLTHHHTAITPGTLHNDKVKLIKL
jgi:hypothetical protein